MAQTYDISGGDTTIKIEVPSNTNVVGCSVISDATLNGAITLKIGQSIDGSLINWFPETPIITDSGANSNLLQTESYVTGSVYLSVEVGSATVGILEIYPFGK